MLYIFDQNGTLVRPCRVCVVFTRGPRSPAQQRLYPRVRPVLDALRARGDRLAIATNQSAVAYGALTMEQAQALVDDCAAKAGGVDATRLCPFHPKAPKTLRGGPNPFARDDPSRKPHPGMILDLMRALGTRPGETVMVGNSRTDRRAARAAGVRYWPARRFFRDFAASGKGA